MPAATNLGVKSLSPLGVSRSVLAGPPVKVSRGGVVSYLPKEGRAVTIFNRGRGMEVFEIFTGQLFCRMIRRLKKFAKITGLVGVKAPGLC